MFDFDSIFTPDDEPPRRADEPARTLAVPERSPTGEFLDLESRAYLAQSQKGVPDCLFVEDGPDGEEVLLNASEFAQAMQLAPGIMPSVEQASAWLTERAGAIHAEWYDRLVEGYEAAEAEAAKRLK